MYNIYIIWIIYIIYIIFMIHKIYHIYHLIHLTYIISIIYIIYFIQYIYYILFIYYVIYVFHEVKCSARDSIYIDNTQQPTKKRRSFFSDLRHLLENATKNRTHLPEAQFVYGALTLLRHTLTDLRISIYMTFKAVKQLNT